ncbi:MAG: nitroreductase family protein [Anaerolineae bacterium]|nr:nitroreductase family protein [Anaerolineae bacterium]
MLPRRMIRQYTTQAVSPEVIERILSAAITAPSPHNRQPWRFAVLRGPARQRLATAMGDKLWADRLRDGDAAEVIARDVARSSQRINSAPVAILACLSMSEMDIYPDARRAAAERWMAGQAVACAVQNLLITAAATGLGACWMCAPLFCPDLVVSTLGLPADWEPQALITLGYPADTGRDRGRKPLSDVVVVVDSE